MPRQARLDVAGTLHHILLRGIEKRKIFDDDLDGESFVNRMAQLAVATKTKIYAWSLLTNHAHILLRRRRGRIAPVKKGGRLGYLAEIRYGRRRAPPHASSLVGHAELRRIYLASNFHRSGWSRTHINSHIIVKTLLYKIPPNLPLPKGGIIPLFEKEGRGEIF